MQITREQVEQLSGPELVTLYGKLTGKPPSRFASRADGVKRVLRALEQGKAIPAVEEPERAPKAAKAAAARPKPEAAPTAAPSKAAKAPKARKPLALAAAGDEKPARAGSKRAQLIEALRSDEGISAEEAMERFGWLKRDVMDALRLTAKKNGIAVREEDGRFYAQE